MCELTKHDEAMYNTSLISIGPSTIVCVCVCVCVCVHMCKFSFLQITKTGTTLRKQTANPLTLKGFIFS